MPVFTYATASGDGRILTFSQDAESDTLEQIDEVEAPRRPAPLDTGQFLYFARRDVNELSSHRIVSRSRRRCRRDALGTNAC